MLGPADALGIGRDLGNVRLYSAFGQLGHGVGYRMQTEISIGAVDARLARRLPSMPARPTGTQEVAGFVEAAIGEASKLVVADSFAERALAVALAYADVIVLGRTADLFGLLLAIEKKPGSPYRDRVMETTPLLASARETCVNALDRFIQGIEHEALAPDVLEAASKLRSRVAAPPPRFDTEEAGHTWRPGKTWWEGLESAMIRVVIALGVPPTDAPKAQAIRALGAEAVKVKHGVVDELVIPADRYVLEWRAIRSTAPVRRVRVTAVRPVLDALLASGALADTL